MNGYQKIEEKLSLIKMLALDVDGVLTTGDLIYGPEGEALKIFNVKDGLGLKLLQENGIIVSIITSRKSSIVSTRMEELGIRFIYQGIDDKLGLLEDLTAQFMMYWNNIAFMGDDVTDIPVLQKVGFSACPSDAMTDVLSHCDYVTTKEGGKGCVREVADLILKNKKN